ncbi:NAD(P)H-dependent oxidoreductase [Tateyamaria omphalii]|uniref:NAD(P)H-dependent oxidoreductase n=1 Tax=Tateyamaria omphalii TaxID=299262 RepID=UPI001C9A2842|nr:NAD(P)H-dependent oxidoreductase [Tateyamaria omphalii]MBY5935439.1 NAD(P)H-dependent oxidoreductase [Tateyamaria omphalii]
MTKRVFIWVAHPKAGSLNAALAERYAKGARAKGAEVRIMHLSDMAPEAGYSEGQDLSPDIQVWQDNIRWADHVMIVHPYWWGAMPAQAKAVMDAGLQSGFAYKYHGRGLGWDKLLDGRTGDAIITADTPTWLDTLLYRSPGRRVMRNQVMKFVGVKPRNVVLFGSVKLAKPEKIDRWLSRAETMGAAAA